MHIMMSNKMLIMVTKVYLHTLATPGVWLFTLVSLVAALLPDVVIRQMKFIFIILSGKHFTDQANRNNIYYLIRQSIHHSPPSNLILLQHEDQR